MTAPITPTSPIEHQIYAAYAKGQPASELLESLQQRNTAFDASFFSSLLSVFVGKSICPVKLYTYLEEAIKPSISLSDALRVYLELLLSSEATVSSSVEEKLSSIYLARLAPSQDLPVCPLELLINLLHSLWSRSKLGSSAHLGLAVLERLPAQEVSFGLRPKLQELQTMIFQHSEDVHLAFRITTALQQVDLAVAPIEEYYRGKEPKAKSFDVAEQYDEIMMLPEIAFAVIQMVNDRLLDNEACAAYLHSILSSMTSSQRQWKDSDTFLLQSMFHSALFTAFKRYQAFSEDSVDKYLWQSWLVSRLPYIFQLFISHHTERKDHGIDLLQEVLDGAQRKFDDETTVPTKLMRAVMSEMAKLDLSNGSKDDLPLSDLEQSVYSNRTDAITSLQALAREPSTVLPAKCEHFTSTFASDPQDDSSLVFTISKAICTDPVWTEVCLVFTDLQWTSAIVSACDHYNPLAGHAAGDGAAFEQFGHLVFALLILYSRYPMQMRAVLANHPGFTCTWISSLTQIHPLGYLDDIEKSLIGGWIRALLSEGISDELLSGTHPQQLLRLAPTIAYQLVTACSMGVIDLETLKDGCSYMTQEMLSFIIPSVVISLAEEMRRNGSTKSTWNSTAQEVLSILLTSDSTPKEALEITLPSIHAVQTAATLSSSLDDLVTTHQAKMKHFNNLDQVLQSVRSESISGNPPPSSLICANARQVVSILINSASHQASEGQTLSKTLLATMQPTPLHYPLLYELLKIDLHSLIEMDLSSYTDLVGGSLLQAQVRSASSGNEVMKEEVRDLVMMWRRTCEGVNEGQREAMRVAWEPYRTLIR